MIEILLVEDDPVLGRGLSVNLEHEGYKVHWATDLKTASSIQKNQPAELVILDLGLPDGNGLQFLKQLRDAGSRIPVLILTAKTNVESVVEGLQQGATDYIRKPFDDRELLARIKIALKEPQDRSYQIRCGEIIVQVDNRKVLFQGTEIAFSPREFDILSFFVQHTGVVVTREALLQTIDKDSEIFDRTIDSNISHVRSRLRRAGVNSLQIIPVYGVGYRLELK